MIRQSGGLSGEPYGWASASAVALATGMLMTAPACAQTSQGQTQELVRTMAGEIEHEPNGRVMQFGGIALYPSARVDLGYDDNVTMSPEAEISSVFTVLRPRIGLVHQTGGDRYALTYFGDLKRYRDSPADDVENHSLELAGNNVFTARNSLSWRAEITDGYDARGTTDRYEELQVLPLEPDHYRFKRAGATYAYGAQDAQGRIEADFGLSSKRYLNNRDTTRTADVDRRELALRFNYRVMPKTSLVFEVTDAQSDYTALDAGLDSSERRYLVGANWAATAATSGRVRVGRHVRDYDGWRKDYSGLGWEVSIDWRPLSYSGFNLVTARQTNDPASSLTDTNYLLSTSVSLQWTHEWSSRWSSVVELGREKAEYDEVTDLAREDEIDHFRIGVFYDLRRWMSAGLEYSSKRRDSNDSRYDYERKITGLVLQMKF